MAARQTISMIIKERGCTQRFVASKMNAVSPGLNMSGSKLSSIILGTRAMSGDELIAFCKAMEVNPDIFLQDRTA